ncbi:hypothetical protein BKP42_36250 [Rhodococcus erythropolis]|uniref:hypothetical protein n=1 Tax=Rhodococcus erythropolis TaxID=1833 RepID=UPI000BB3B5F8|nr:hypothetical protein [Rhodococcus erythropolis]PBI96965.1 hypothetical protein BKP42_36250 [Rhodococcus erythropolis]
MSDKDLGAEAIIRYTLSGIANILGVSIDVPDETIAGLAATLQTEIDRLDNLTNELAKIHRQALGGQVYTDWDDLSDEAVTSSKTAMAAVLAHLQSAGRLLAADETPFTAEQVEDVRALVWLDGRRNFDAFYRLRALFPATEPAEDASKCTICGVVERAHFNQFDDTHPFTTELGPFDDDGNDRSEPITDLIEKSSLGTESAQALIDTVSPEHGRRIAQEAARREAVRRSKEVIALAKFMYAHGNPELSDEDREIIGPWEGLDEIAQTIWINLAGAAYDHLADRMSSENAVHIHHHDIESHAASYNEGYDEAVRQLTEPVEEPHFCRDPECDACNAAECPAPAEPAEEETKAEEHRSVIHSNRTIKTVSEALSYAETALLNTYPDSEQRAHYAEVIAELLRDIARQRPVGSNGKHGELHTPTCGCADVPASSPVVPAPTETGPWIHRVNGEICVASPASGLPYTIGKFNDHGDFVWHSSAAELPEGFAPFIATEENS